MSEIRLEDFIQDKVELLLPHQVKGIELVNATQTSLSIKWKASRSKDVVLYNIYVDGVLVDGTQGLSYEVTGLEHSRDYVIAIKAVRKSGQESHPTTIKFKTLSTYVLSMPGKNGNYVQAPEIAFDAVELIVEMRPKANAWGNILIQGLLTPVAKEYQVSTQFDGLRFLRKGFDETYADEVLYKDQYVAPLPINKKISLRVENKVFGITEVLRFFGSRDDKAASLFAGSLHRVRFYKRNDLSKLEVLSDYDFTYLSEGKVEDILGNSEPLVIVGTEAKFVTTDGGAL